MRYFILILFVCFTQFSFSQIKELKKADEQFNSFNYTKAISEYKKVLGDSTEIYYCSQRIAEAYAKLDRNQEAIDWYLKCMGLPESKPEIALRIVQLYLKEGNQEEASAFFQKYYNKKELPHQLNSITFMEYYHDLMSDSARYNLISLSFNSKYDEFGPTLYGEDMVFTSNRPVSGVTKRSDIQTGQAFFNLFTANQTSPEVKLFSKELQSKYNDGPVCFSADGQTAYVTRNIGTSNDEVNPLDIYVSSLDGKKWSKQLRRLPLRKGNYSVAHAFLTSDNKYIYFASDMPGGFGGMDIYVCEIKNGFLTPPLNLGELINTSGNEIFPFVDMNGSLYFASDMHPGLGGYDLFFANLLDGEYIGPFNMGYPVNSPADDFSLSLDTNNRFGIFSSNREGGAGGDDIYAVQLVRPLKYCSIDAKVINAVDSTLLSDAVVNITEVENSLEMALKTDQSGKFSCYLKKDKTYSLSITHQLYSDFKAVLSPAELQSYDILNLNIAMEKK
jgi:tetratricopeptide (TPR) repeat protein